MRPTRRKRSPFARLLRYWPIGLLIVALITVVAVLVLRLPQFAITDVQIAPSAHTSSDQIATAAQIRLGANLWLTNITAARARVAALPWVASVSISRRPPGHIEIAVVERKPVAVIVVDGRPGYWVDRDLHVLSRAEGHSELPQIDIHSEKTPTVGSRYPLAQRGYTDLGILAQAGVRVRRLAFDRYSDVRVWPERGPQILFASGAALRAGSTIAGALIERALREHRVVRVIDIRAPEAPVFRY